MADLWEETTFCYLKRATLLLGLAVPLAACFDPSDGGAQDTEGTSGAGTGGTDAMRCMVAEDCDDQDPCTDDACDAGACAHTPRTDDPACSCQTAADCDQLPADDACRTRACEDGVCRSIFAEQGTPLPEIQQTEEDCLVVTCDGAGGTEEIPDDTDVPDDGLECTADVCEAGVPSNPPAEAGTACAAGTCDDAGNCTGCETPADCGGEDTFCHAVTCIDGICGVEEAPAETPLPDGEQTTGDCQRLVCDGQGNPVPMPEDEDLPPDDDNACTEAACDSGNIQHLPVEAGSTCDANGGIVCDGEGACVECVDDSQCTMAGTCQVPVCMNNACAVADAPFGTSCDDGLFCTETDECDGEGNCVGSDDPCPGGDGDGDCSESCNESSDSCTANDPNGASCNDGLFCTDVDTCNGSGSCTGSGNPCPGPDGDSDCTETCNETTNSCSSPDPNGSDCGNCRTCSGGTCDFLCQTGEACCPEFEICLEPQFC